MKINKLIYILAFFVSCSQEINDNTSSSYLPFLVQKSSDKILIDTNDYWVLKNKFSDDRLFFKKYQNKNNIPFEKWVFIFSDSNVVSSFINYEPSCAMGISIVDTTIWIEINNNVDINIKGVQIGYSDFEISYQLEKVFYSDTEIILKKIE